MSNVARIAVVELPNAFEARVGSDLRDRKLGLVEQLARKMDPPRARDSYRRRSQMLEEQPAQMTGAETDTLGKCLNIVRHRAHPQRSV